MAAKAGGAGDGNTKCLNNFKPFGARDEASREDGDASFIGVEERLPAQQLQPGYVARAKNKRFRTGRCATRDGITMLPWGPVDGRTAWGEVYGGFVYQDVRQGGQWILIAAALAGGQGGIWKTRPSYVAKPVPLPMGTVLTRATFRKFVQCNGEILLLRGAGNDTLHCTDLEEGFKPIVQVNVWVVSFDHATNWVGLPAHNVLAGDPVRFKVGAGTGLPASVIADATYYVLDTPNGDSFTISAAPGGTQVLFSTGDGDVVVDVGEVRLLDGAEPIPACEDGIAVGNRAILVPAADPATGSLTIQDRLIVTDIGDVTRAQVLGSEFRINEGDGYSLVTVRIFNADTLVCYKSGNVQKVTGVSGDLSQAQGPLNVTEAYGAVGAQAVGAYGNEIYWVNSELRLTSLQLTALNQDQNTDVALSDPLVQTLGRLNATYAGASRIAVQDGYLLWALPLDEAEIVSLAELVAAGQTYTASVPVTVGVTAGATYKYFQGANAGKLVNGTEVLAGDANFIAQGGTVTLFAGAQFPTVPASCLDSLRQVTAVGVNTAVAVYDFLNGAWAGTDEGAGVTHVIDWLKFEHGGRPRLGFIGADGFLHLYGEGYEDDLLTPIAQPYVDVIVQDYSKLGTGDTLQVNGGTVATAVATDAVNQVGLGTRWGTIGTLGGPNLWRDAGGKGGFDGTATSPWSAPNTVATQIADGVRFTATNGIAPFVVINGGVVADGVSDWALVDAFNGSTIQSVAIVDLVRTRAYRCVVYYGSSSETGRMRRYLQVAGLLGTWSPKYSIAALVQGQNASQEYVTEETRDRTKYFAPFDQADFDVGNPADTYDAPRREDYSWTDSGAGGANGLGMLIGTGATWDAVQEYVHRVPVSENGLWLQLEITNEDGHLELIATAMESEDGQVLAGPAIA